MTNIAWVRCYGQYFLTRSHAENTKFLIIADLELKFLDIKKHFNNVAVFFNGQTVISMFIVKSVTGFRFLLKLLGTEANLSKHSSSV